MIFYFHSKKILFYSIIFSLANHLEEISKILTSDINEMTNYKFAFKYPYIVSEILSNPNEKIANKLFIIEGENTPLILQILKTLNENNIQDSTIPGYITKIIIAHIPNDNIFNCIFPYLNEFFDFLFKHIEYDSFRDIAFEIINKGLNSDNKYNFIELFDNLVKKLKEPNIEQSKLENEIWLIIALCRTNEIIFQKIDEILSVIVSIFLEKDEKTMSNLPYDIKSKEECDKYTSLMKLITNCLFIGLKNNNKDILSFNLCITNLIDTNRLSNLMNDLSNIDILTTFNGNTNDGCKLIGKNINLLYTVFKKCDEFLQNHNLSSCTLFLSNLLDTLIILLTFNPKFPILTPTFLIDLIKLMIEFPNHTIISQKVTKIFEIYDKENSDCTELINNIEQILSKSTIEEVFINNEIISNKSPISHYLIYFIKIYISLKGNNENIEIIQKYNDIISKGLYQGILQPETDIVQKNEDEEPIEQTKDIHDTEAFLFTTKKILEDSKKVSKKLKEIDNL